MEVTVSSAWFAHFGPDHRGRDSSGRLFINSRPLTQREFTRLYVYTNISSARGPGLYISPWPCLQGKGIRRSIMRIYTNAVERRSWVNKLNARWPQWVGKSYNQWSMFFMNLTFSSLTLHISLVKRLWNVSKYRLHWLRTFLRYSTTHVLSVWVLVSAVEIPRGRDSAWPGSNLGAGNRMYTSLRHIRAGQDGRQNRVNAYSFGVSDGHWNTELIYSVWH